MVDPLQSAVPCTSAPPDRSARLRPDTPSTPESSSLRPPAVSESPRNLAATAGPRRWSAHPETAPAACAAACTSAPASASCRPKAWPPRARGTASSASSPETPPSCGRGRPPAGRTDRCRRSCSLPPSDLRTSRSAAPCTRSGLSPLPRDPSLPTRPPARCPRRDRSARPASAASSSSPRHRGRPGRRSRL